MQQWTTEEILSLYNTCSDVSFNIHYPLKIKTVLKYKIAPESYANKMKIITIKNNTEKWG